MATTRVYKFYPAKWGREAIIEQRLKLTTLENVNDTFELCGANISNRKTRSILNEWKSNFEKRFAFISFCISYKNPLLWGHYAENCSGICLGFDITENCLRTVKYLKHKIFIKAEDLASQDTSIENRIEDLLLVKYIDWSYEREKRYFHKLSCKDIKKKESDENKEILYFLPFGEKFALREIILGPKYTREKDPKRSESILRSLQSFETNENVDKLEIKTMRAAFKKFTIVEQKNKSLQKMV